MAVFYIQSNAVGLPIVFTVQDEFFFWPENITQNQDSQTWKMWMVEWGLCYCFGCDTSFFEGKSYFYFHQCNVSIRRDAFPSEYSHRLNN